MASTQNNNKTFQVVPDTYMIFRMFESPSHLHLKEILQNMNFNKDLKFTLLQTLVKLGYWFENNLDLIQAYDGYCYSADVNGTYGYIDNKNSHSLIDKRPLANPQMLSTRIIVEITDELYQKIAVELKAKAATLQITPGPRGNVYSSLESEKLTRRVENEFGVYKLDIFDTAFEAYKKLCSFMNDDYIADDTPEIKFATFFPENLDNWSCEIHDYDRELMYNHDLVEIKPVTERPGITPLDTFIKGEYLPTGLYKLILTIHDVDLAANMPQLKEILTLFT